MKIEKLARLIVDDYYDGAPDEAYQIAIEREVKKLRASSFIRDADFNGERMVRVVLIEVEDE